MYAGNCPSKMRKGPPDIWKRCNFKNIASGHNITQCMKTIRSSVNKASLIKFLVHEWKGPRHREKPLKTLHVTCEVVRAIFFLERSHWHAVTHAPYSRIRLEDSGFLCWRYQCLISIYGLRQENSIRHVNELWIARFLDITKLRQLLVGGYLIGMYAFIWCDTVGNTMWCSLTS